MISAAYCRTMARYNAWQTDQLCGVLAELDRAALTQDRGAFFGSILRTLSHLVWADWGWISRFDGGSGPECALDQSPDMFSDLETWQAARQQLDARIQSWAGQVTDAELASDLSFYSGVLQQDVTRPFGPCAVHFFNHQTHHRGQVHCMLTAAGATAPVSDLFLIPEDA